MRTGQSNALWLDLWSYKCQCDFGSGFLTFGTQPLALYVSCKKHFEVLPKFIRGFSGVSLPNQVVTFQTYSL